MGALKGFGWLRSGAARAAQPDPADMGTAFGLDAYLAATSAEATRVPSEAPTAAAVSDPSLRAPGAGAGFWRRLGGRFTPGR